jgi:naphthoate synthase
VPIDKLEDTTLEWCKKIQEKSPLAIRMLKSSFNAELDGQAGIQELAGNATLLYYLSDEAKEGRNAFVEKRKPDWKKFPKFP